MCVYCRRISDHHPSCPNFIDKGSFGKCGECNDPIGSYEEYIEINGDYYHLDCLSSMPIYKLLYTLDIPIEQNIPN